MFSLNHSQNTLKQVKVTFTLPSGNKTYTGTTINEIIEVTPSYAVYSIKDSQGRIIKTNRGNGTLTGTELNMGVNNGENASYSIYPLGDENYTYVLDNQQSVTGTFTIGPAALTASTTTGSATYNGSSQSVTVISGINGTYSGSTSASGINVGSYQTTITGNGNYSGSVTGTLTIGAAPASSSGAYGTTIYSGYDDSYQSRVVIFNVSGLTYTGDTIVSLKKNVGTYPTSITLTGNYTGTLTGYLVITEAAGFISLFSGDYIQNGNTNTVLFSRYLQSAVSTYVFTSSVSGPGAGDAWVQEGYGVQSTSYATAGFTVTLTATITDPNYTRGSATTTITFLGYTPPPGGDGIAE
jgi:hypothetical protein